MGRIEYDIKSSDLGKNPGRISPNYRRTWISGRTWGSDSEAPRKPEGEELVVDEMLAIRSEIDAWREKKASQQANARYNEILYYGLEGVDEE